jgi:hypothetical protein
MVAVFLAASVLAGGNIRHAHFTLRSDNLLRDQDIVFTVTWISTVENLADAPSQGQLPPISELFPHIIHCPFFLKKFVENPVRAETWARYTVCT